MPQSQRALIAAMPLQKETKGREWKVFRLLLHKEVQQHGDADKQKAGQE